LQALLNSQQVSASVILHLIPKTITFFPVFQTIHILEGQDAIASFSFPEQAKVKPVHLVIYYLNIVYQIEIAFISDFYTLFSFRLRHTHITRFVGYQQVA